MIVPKAVTCSPIWSILVVCVVLCCVLFVCQIKVVLVFCTVYNLLFVAICEYYSVLVHKFVYLDALQRLNSLIHVFDVVLAKQRG
ncbi:hypothetical protein QVD17_18719 [Tagetes erecta]|uniref:Uncharacterized protein n=1 Tax=Tagetes erecta TaxID=13708 RepID=A0AAD8KLQ7_TARER|nr:hypothetical protein QVD17_18719 [Tagetes erecta]